MILMFPKNPQGHLVKDEDGWQSGVRSYIMPRHLVQELNVGTVHVHALDYMGSISDMNHSEGNHALTNQISPSDQALK